MIRMPEGGNRLSDTSNVFMGIDNSSSNQYDGKIRAAVFFFNFPLHFITTTGDLMTSASAAVQIDYPLLTGSQSALFSAASFSQ